MRLSPLLETFCIVLYCNFYCYQLLFQLTWADCAIFATVDSLNLRDACEKFPKVVACVKKVEANKNIAKWIKERPVTPF